MMTQPDEKTARAIETAFSHYIAKLTEIQNKPDNYRQNSTLVEEEIGSYIEMMRKTSSALNQGHTHDGNIELYKEELSYALDYYLNELMETRNALAKALSGHFPKLGGLDDEIEIVQKAIEKYGPNEKKI